MLTGDKGCPDFVATSVYDTKPVHYLSMVCEELKWVVNKKEVFNVDTGRMEILQFLQMNNIHDYNMTMGDVDVADQLRGNYWMDLRVRNWKWWWSIMLWSFSVILINSYIIYLLTNLEEGTLQSRMLSHHDFQCAVAMAWINPKEYLEDLEKKKNSFLGKRKRASVDKVSKKSAVSSISFKDASLPVAAIQNPRVTDQLLDPKNGNLWCQLDSSYDHLPEKPKCKRPKCQLHRWSGKEEHRWVMHCPTCLVHLCIFCYKKFHMIRDLKRSKMSIRNHKR